MDMVDLESVESGVYILYEDFNVETGSIRRSWENGTKSLEKGFYIINLPKNDILNDLYENYSFGKVSIGMNGFKIEAMLENVGDLDFYLCQDPKVVGPNAGVRCVHPGKKAVVENEDWIFGRRVGVFRCRVKIIFHRNPFILPIRTTTKYDCVIYLEGDDIPTIFPELSMCWLDKYIIKMDAEDCYFGARFRPEECLNEDFEKIYYLLRDIEFG